jgi:6-phosphofructokinase
MGRDSGFIAAFSVLVDSQANFCLVPEVPFTLEKFLFELKLRLERRGRKVQGKTSWKKTLSATLLETSSTETSELFCVTRSKITLSK